MESTAEGIENENEKVVMRDLGCTQLQGYLFGRPAEGQSEPTPSRAVARLARRCPPRPSS